MAVTIPSGDNEALDASGSSRDPVEVLADEFVRRRRCGEKPTIAEYVTRYPHLAHAIRQVFPALLALEQVGPCQADGSLVPTGFPSSAGPVPSIGDYRILREIGRGAMGVVYEADQQSLDRRVALKVLPWHATKSGIAVERFRREARAAARLHHTNIVPVFDVGEEGQVCYYAMQYIPGQPLDQVLIELRKSRSESPTTTWPRYRKGGVREGESSREAQLPDVPRETIRVATDSTIREANRVDGSRWLVESTRGDYFRNVARLGHQVADALAYAHSRGIIHRDIKPSNLLLDPAGTVWVTDFGLAKTEEAGITRTGDLLGTLRYMAPERFRGECDARADVYSLGATLYELVTLQPAHDARDSADLIARIANTDPTPPRSIDRNVPRDLELIVLKALDRDRRHRYDSADALAEDLRRFLNDEPILGRRPPLTERFARWARHNRTLAAVTVTTAVLLLVAAIVSTVASASFQSLAQQERAARIETTTHLYRSLVREAEAVRLARREGYREAVWSLLDRARGLDTPEVDRDELRREAAQSLGDFVGQRSLVITGFPSPARSLAVGDGLLAVGLESGVIRWYASDKAAPVAERQSHFAPVEKIAYLTDTQTFYSADSRGVVKAWKQQDHLDFETAPLADFGGPLLDLVPVREGHIYAVRRRYAADSELVVENLATRKTVAVDPRAKVTVVALSRGGDQLAVACDDELLVYSTRTGGLIQRTTTELGPFLRLSFSRNGLLLFAGCEQGLVVYDLPELRQQTFMRSGEVTLGVFSPDGAQLAFAGRDRRITLWNFRGNRELAALAHPGWQSLHSLELDRHGQILATADAQSVKVWDLNGSAERTSFVGHSAGVTSVSLSRDGAKLATAGKDRILALWDVHSRKQLAAASMPGVAETIAFDRTGDLVVAGDRAGNVRLYDGRSLRQLAEIPHSLGSIYSVRFLAEGRLAMAGDGGLALWRVHQNREGADEAMEPGDVWVEPVRHVATSAAVALADSGDGHFVAWRDAAGQLHAAEVDSGVEWPLHAPLAVSVSHCLAFSGTGRELLFVDQQGRLIAWDVATDRERIAIKIENSSSAGLIAHSGGSDLLAVATSPMQLALWNRATRQALLLLREERTAMSALSFSSNGKRLAVGTQDGGVSVWNVPALRQQLATLELDWADQELAPAHDGVLPLEALTRAIEHSPDDAQLLARRGTIRNLHGDDLAALKDFEAALVADPEHLPALVGRAELYANQQRLTEAAAEYRRVLALEPENFDRWFATAVLLAGAGERQEYREHCRQLLGRYGAESDPNRLEQSVLACLLLPDVIAASELPLARLEALVHSPLIDGQGQCRSWITLALAAVRDGDLERALANVGRAQSESIHSATPELQALSFAVLAIIQSELGQAQVARSSLEASSEFMQGMQPSRVLKLLQSEARRSVEK